MSKDLYEDSRTPFRRWAWLQALPPRDKIVLLALAEGKYNPNGEAFTSYREVAARTFLTQRQIHQNLSNIQMVTGLRIYEDGSQITFLWGEKVS